MAFVRDLILQSYPNAHIVGEPTKTTTGALEVTVDGQTVHSKLKGDGVIDKKNQAAFMEKVKKVAG